MPELTIEVSIRSMNTIGIAVHWKINNLNYNEIKKSKNWIAVIGIKFYTGYD
jgi:hypothetical protein